MTGDLIVDLFGGGARGWSHAARQLGFPATVGIEKDRTACRTAVAAGLLTVCADVETYPPERFVGRAVGICGSPPCTDYSQAGKRRGLDGATGRLVYEPVRWATIVHPGWICLEQVPEVDPIWRVEAAKLRALGYRTWTGILDAADYGVPQNRQRAVLIASLTRRVSHPTPTHTETPDDSPTLFGGTDGRQQWVSMADALGWDGELGYIRGKVISERHGDRPARSTDRPAPTITASRAGGGGGTKYVLHTNRDQRPDGIRQTRDVDRPAPAVTGKAGGQWDWAWTRPATMVQGTDRIAKPGHHDRQFDGATKVTIAELGQLQDFPADHPWQGNKSQQATQIGNAIPVGLARAVLAEAVGVPNVTTTVEARRELA